jgi:hypothetical protein
MSYTLTYLPNGQISLTPKNKSINTIEHMADETKTLSTKYSPALQNLITVADKIITNGLFECNDIKTNSITTQKLCVGNTCITESELKNLKNNTFDKLSVNEINTNKININNTSGNPTISMTNAYTHNKCSELTFQADGTKRKINFVLGDKCDALGMWASQDDKTSQGYWANSGQTPFVKYGDNLYIRSDRGGNLNKYLANHDTGAYFDSNEKGVWQRIVLER